MKVLQILPELNTGGVERGTLELGRHLVATGHESLVVSDGGRLVEELESQGSRHIALPVHRKRLSSLAQVGPLRELIERERPDIVHARSRVPAWLARLALRKLPAGRRPKWITTVHGFYSVNAYSRVMTTGEAVICVSDSVRDYVLAHYRRVDPGRITVIHRGVDPARYPRGYRPGQSWLELWKQAFPQLEGRFVVTLPGRITRWKGQLQFVDMIDRLRREGVPAHGLIAGSPHPRKQAFMTEVKAAITERGLDRDITLAGHRDDLREILAVSDAVVSCSTDPEAFGRVTLEALALGRPVAGYDHGGVREQLAELLPDGRVPVGDTSAMARLLAAWHRDPPVPAADNPFTLDAMLGKTLAVYTRVTE